MGRPRHTSLDEPAENPISKLPSIGHRLSLVAPASNVARSSRRAGDRTSVLLLFGIVGMACLASVPDLKLHVRHILDVVATAEGPIPDAARPERPPFPLAGVWRDIAKHGASIAMIADSRGDDAVPQAAFPTAIAPGKHQQSDDKVLSREQQLIWQIVLDSTSAVPQATLATPKSAVAKQPTIASLEATEPSTTDTRQGQASHRADVIRPLLSPQTAAVSRAESALVKANYDPPPPRTIEAQVKYVASRSEASPPEKRPKRHTPKPDPRPDPSTSDGTVFREINRARP